MQQEIAKQSLWRGRERISTLPSARRGDAQPIHAVPIGRVIEVTCELRPDALRAREIAERTEPFEPMLLREPEEKDRFEKADLRAFRDDVCDRRSDLLELIEQHRGSFGARRVFCAGGQFDRRARSRKHVSSSHLNPNEPFSTS
jgi:hypothetical protein